MNNNLTIRLYISKNLWNIQRSQINSFPNKKFLAKCLIPNALNNYHFVDFRIHVQQCIIYL